MNIKKGLTLLLLAALTLLLALPCAAAEEEMYYQSVDYTAVVNDDGTAKVRQTLTAVFPTGGGEADLHLYTNNSLNTYYVSALTVQGNAPCEADLGDYTSTVHISSEKAGTYTYVLDYTLIFRDDLNNAVDWVELDFYTRRLYADIRSFTAQVTLPPAASVRKWELQDDVEGQLNPGYLSLEQQGNVFRVQSTQPMRSYEGAALYVECEPGLFTKTQEVPAEYVIKERTCDITVDSEMTYTVREHVVVETNNRRGSLNLPVVNFQDYEVRYTMTPLRNSDNVEVQESSYQDGVYYYLQTEDELGTFTADYSYTLRAAKLDTPLALDFSSYSIDRMDAMTITLTAAGISGAKAELPYTQLARVPQTQRIACTQQGDRLTVTLLRPVYDSEGIQLSAKVDLALYSRPISVTRAAALIAAAICLLLCMVGKVLFGTTRPLHSEKEEPLPPENINSAEAGYLKDGVLTNAELTSLVPQWVAKGWMTAEENGSEFIFHSVTQPMGAPAYEQTLYRAMFGYGANGYVTTVQLRGKFHKDVSAARMALTAQYRGARALQGGTSAKWVCMVLSALPVFVLCMTAALHTDGLLWALVSGTACMLGQLVLSGLCLLIFAPSKGALPAVSNGQVMIKVGAAVLLGIGTLLWRAMLCEAFPDVSGGLALGVIVLSLCGAAVSATFLRRGTVAYSLLCRVRGFYETLAGTRSFAMKKRIKTEEAYAANMLPYAQVFGIAQSWVSAASGAGAAVPEGVSASGGFAGYEQQTRRLLRVLRSCSVPGAQ